MGATTNHPATTEPAVVAVRLADLRTHGFWTVHDTAGRAVHVPDATDRSRLSVLIGQDRGALVDVLLSIAAAQALPDRVVGLAHWSASALPVVVGMTLENDRSVTLVGTDGLSVVIDRSNSDGAALLTAHLREACGDADGDVTHWFDLTQLAWCTAPLVTNG